jgi:hypothetical protein
MLYLLQTKYMVSKYAVDLHRLSTQSELNNFIDLAEKSTGF